MPADGLRVTGLLDVSSSSGLRPAIKSSPPFRLRRRELVPRL
jgi:hypothetical protein